jgi:hypothetical protein
MIRPSFPVSVSEYAPGTVPAVADMACPDTAFVATADRLYSAPIEYATALAEYVAGLSDG